MEDVALTNSIIENVKEESAISHLEESSILSATNLNTITTTTTTTITKSKEKAIVEVIDLDASSNSIDNINKFGLINNLNNKMHNRSNPRQNSNITTVTETSSKLKSQNTVSANLNNSNNTNVSTLNTSNTQIDTNEKESLEEKYENVIKTVKITSRIVFLKVGQVDTRNERFDAEAFIECSWEDDNIFKILSDPNMAKNIHSPNALELMLKQAQNATLNTNNLTNLKNIINNISLLEYDTNVFWSPQLYIENAIGELKEEIRHKLEIVEREGSNLLDDPNFNPKNGQFKELINNLTVRVCEMRKLRGVFYERLELYDFPMDMQELSITLTSKRNSSEVQIVENLKDPCSINTEDFLDQQEWDLFSHVKTSQKTIYDPWRKYERTGFSVSCYIARKPGYYLYNAYMLIFLITILGFVPFAFDSGAPQFRCQVTGLLLLTSVNFRWIVTQRLPSVPYLTSLDKYAIGSLLYLVLFCVWHSIIGSNIITSDSNNRKQIDYYVLYGSAATCLIYNLFYLLWFFKMFKSIRKFQTDGLKEQAIQAEKRDKLNKAINNNNNNSNNNTGKSLNPISNEDIENLNVDNNENSNNNRADIQKKTSSTTITTTTTTTTSPNRRKESTTLNKSQSIRRPTQTAITNQDYALRQPRPSQANNDPSMLLTNA